MNYERTVTLDEDDHYFLNYLFDLYADELEKEFKEIWSTDIKELMITEYQYFAAKILGAEFANNWEAFIQFCNTGKYP